MLFPQMDVSLTQTKTYLMTSKKQAGHLTSNFYISLSKTDFSKSSANYLGKSVSDFQGTRFDVYDDGEEKQRDEVALKRQARVIAELYFDASMWKKENRLEVYVREPQEQIGDDSGLALKEIYQGNKKKVVKLVKKTGVWD